MRRFTLFCILAAVAAIAPAMAQQARVPASYPHDLSTFECTHHDGDVCDRMTMPPPDYTPIVGTWVRISILRKGFSVQPPDAPLMVKFMNDGWWSMMEFPAGRTKVNKPLEQQTPQELFNRFDRMSGGWGNYTNMGQINYRHHLETMSPDAAHDQVRGWHFNDNELVMDGTGSDNSPIVSFRKLPNQPLGSKALVGSWDRTAYSVNGVSVTAPPEHLLLGEDGWYQATVLPPGRVSKRGIPMQQWTTADLVTGFKGMEGSWGTYNVEGTSFLRRQIGDVDPNLEDKLASGSFKLNGDSFTWTGTDAAGRKFEATYRRAKPFPIYEPLKRAAAGGD